DDLAGLARRFWIPVWEVPAGVESPQHVLQYPICLIVISDAYARFYGVVSGLSTTTLSGRGWAVGLMLQPAAGALLCGGSLWEYTDRYVDLGAIEALGSDLVGGVRDAMTPDPSDSGAHAAARRLIESSLRPLLPVDEEGLLINAIVATVEDSPDILRVGQLCERFDMPERTLQRLTRRRLGLSPKWLIRRRRLHEAAGRLRDPGNELATLAIELGYSDQAHLTRDFRAATGMTPGGFARRWRAQPDSGSR
ncbi:MAG: AraC family transcriptional regulator, partial [Bowdeniella nasicola]|nr:AraC family transcriptional regulator [Bowdeniella nasicola]